MLTFLNRYWQALRRPSTHFNLGLLTPGGCVAGVIFSAKPACGLRARRSSVMLP